MGIDYSIAEFERRKRLIFKLWRSFVSLDLGARMSLFWRRRGDP